jgi:hypothetical protein
MIIKHLTRRQARWAKAIVEYHFIIMYHTRKENAKADALTRKDDEVEFQDGVKTKYRTKAFLSEDQIDPQVLEELNINEIEVSINALEESKLDDITLIDHILQNNRQAPSLQALQTQTQENNDDNSGFTLEDGLLLYKERLVVLEARL